MDGGLSIMIHSVIIGIQYEEINGNLSILDMFIIYEHGWVVTYMSL